MNPAKLWDRLFAIATGFSALLCLFVLVSILTAIVYHGFSKIDLSFLFTETTGAGFSGGIRYQIIGTVILITTAVVVVTPFAVALSLSQTAFVRSKFIKESLQLGIQMLNATPSIVFGILGFLFFVKELRLEKSWVSGGIVLGLMILPTMTVALSERLHSIPSHYIQQAHALGFDGEQLTWAILLPYGWGGLLTGIVLGLARAAGETAPIMLTAAVFSGATIPTGIKDSPVLALPYHIFNLAQDVYSPDATAVAWATAAVLTLLVLMVSAFAIPFRSRSHEEAKK